MANVVAGNLYWFAGGDATWLQPGQSHEWYWNLGNLGEAISISVRPFAAIFGNARVIVENVIVSDGPAGLHQALFRVRNVGPRPIGQYTVTGAFISP
jgi:hypothetical protein